MTSEQIQGVLRAILAALGGFIIAKGWITIDMWNWIVGGVISIIPAIWSMWSNRPAGVAAQAQALPGVNVQTTAAAAPAVAAAVDAVKAAG